jgi:hypothetical protein
MKEHIMKDFDQGRGKIRQKLQNVPGRISFTLDCWTSPNIHSFLGITSHFVDGDWNLQELLVDFVELSGPHSGDNICAAFERMARENGILGKVDINCDL